MGHGTHVAATAAGNGLLKGVAPDAKIVAYKALSAAGWGKFSWIISAINDSTDPNKDGDTSDHLDVISLSIGASCMEYNEGCGPDDPISQAINNAVDNGVVAVIAAGNCGPGGNPNDCARVGDQTITSPGTAIEAITVGAVNKQKEMAGFSSRGPVNWKSNNGINETMIKPDIVAPGVSICAAQYDGWLEGQAECNPELEGHIAISGTSMATPHVSGLVALIKQRNPFYTPKEIKSLSH